jgi:hypothetical protein
MGRTQGRFIRLLSFLVLPNFRTDEPSMCPPAVSACWQKLYALHLSSAISQISSSLRISCALSIVSFRIEAQLSKIQFVV